MRRAPIVLTTTAVGVVGVLSFHARRPEVAALASASGGSTSSSPSPAGAKTSTGDAVDTQYGPAQVQVTIAGGRITDVTALQLQSNDPKSAQISSYAAPLLRQSALDKQSGDIDAVSGATFTSASYEASLQSALDKAGFTAADGSRGGSSVPQGGGGPGGGGGHDQGGDPDGGPGFFPG